MTKTNHLKISDKYRFLGAYHLHLPRSKDQVTFDLLNQLAIYKEDLHASLQFSFHPFILNILDLYQVVPT